MARHSTAHYLLEGLCELGIDYLFCNLGTDHVPLIEEMARWDRGNRPRPPAIICPHETVAVHMAGGYAAMTGRGQAVLVHVDAGTANAAMALHNLCRHRLPVFLMAGRAPYTTRGEMTGSRDTYVHFIQDPYDIASLVRPYTGWEYCLPSGVVVKELLSRGHAVMQSEPMGPVFLTLPRETLAEEIEEEQVRSFPPARFGAVAAGGAAPEAVAEIARRIMEAEQPVAFCGYLGRRPEAVAALDALSREAGIRVVSHATITVNCPADSPCFAGFDPAPLLEEADLGLLLDTDVPWIPALHRENPATRWIQVDVDAAKRAIPLWNFPAELRVQGDCATVLRQVLAAIRERADDAFRTRVAARMAGWAPAREARLRRLAAEAARPGEPDAIGVPFLLAALNRRLSAEDIVVNEAIRNGVAVQDHIPRTVPGSFIGFAGGGLGFSGGMALGAKLACPERRVVQIVGDGSFHFSAPDSVYVVAQNHGLPIFTLVLDNRGWSAVKEATRRVYPRGVAVEEERFFARLDLRGERRFEEAAKAFGAHGERVTRAEEVEAAIDRCLAALERGQAAVLTARVTPL
ncbi:thiamine pyrophosphate-requiring protein [Crenalkalicoccus roseus]|uniref:thiamine pyrophosphate-requiring protein n=1 Tax=Crenalkalicoccus roseus TaxID=1485588 RepID=UPI0010802717|nr:thiamine pyrophosphate-requiring protein [Crenalkalicoccus roseus]